MNPKRIVGLTGNIATGKSVILHLAAERGALTIDADREVHAILATDDAVQQAIRAAFGAEVFTPEGSIHRPALGQRVFADPSQLQILESIVHPVVRRRILEQVRASTATIIFIEAIKLLEGPLKDACNQIWVTTCAPHIQIERLVHGRGLDAAAARQRVLAQSPQADKIALADVVIDTNGTMSDTVAQFEKAWRELMSGEIG